MKAKKKPILITALSVLLCLSLVFGFMFKSPVVAFAASMSSDNEYVFDFGNKVHIVGWYGTKGWAEDLADFQADSDVQFGLYDWWNDAVATYNGRRWKTEPYMRWQNGEDLQHHFIAWYPEDLAKSTDNLTKVPITITGNIKKDDILLARWSGARPEDNVLNMQFDHLLSRFEVNLDFADQYEGDITEISIDTRLRNTAKADLLTGNVTETSGNDVVMTGSNYIADGYDWSGACITVPHEFSSEELLVIKFTVDGEPKVLTYTHPTELTFESGHKTTLNLKVGLDVVEIETVTVGDWADGGTIDAGEAEECMHTEYDADNVCTACGKKEEDGQ